MTNSHQSPYRDLLAIVGVNFRTLGVAEREKVLLPGGVTETLRSLAEAGKVAEAVLIATCNRCEFVVVGEAAEKACQEFIIGRLGPKANADSLYLLRHEEAVRHLMRVAASLDSMVVGEGQILGQVKSAYQLAQELGLVRKTLHKLFQYTLGISKKIRERTGIAGHGISVSYIAVQLAVSIFGDLRQVSSLILGSGRMAELVALHLRSKGCTNITVANRTVERAAQLAARCHGQVISLADIEYSLATADVVVGSLAIDRPLVEIAAVRKLARTRPLFFIDLGVPRNFPAELGNLENVYLYNIDDLTQIAAQHQKIREDAAADAGVLIEYGVYMFERWLHKIAREPWLLDLQGHIAAICATEVVTVVTRELQDLPESICERIRTTLSETLASRITPKILAMVERGDEGEE